MDDLSNFFEGKAPDRTPEQAMDDIVKGLEQSTRLSIEKVRKVCVDRLKQDFKDLGLDQPDPAQPSP